MDIKINREQKIDVKLVKSKRIQRVKERKENLKFLIINSLKSRYNTNI